LGSKARLLLANEALIAANLDRLRYELEKSLRDAPHEHAWLFAMALFVVVLSFVYVVRKIVLVSIHRHRPASRNVLLVDMIYKVTRPYIVIAFSAVIAAGVYDLPPLFTDIAHISLLAGILWRAVKSIDRLTSLIVTKLLDHIHSEQKRNTVSYLHSMFRVIIWAAAVVFLLDNCGLHINGILTSLGIGGLAMAIAGQSIIVDIIASAALFMDQPFVVGDKIWFKDYEGYVLHIGFKTTKLAGENDEIIVVPNSILSTSIVRSYTYTAFSMKSHMDIDLNTPVELIKTLETNLRQDLASLEAIQQDETVVYFKELKRHAIHLEIRYKVESPTYNCRFLREIQGRVNTRINHIRNDLSIRLAYPEIFQIVSSIYSHQAWENERRKETAKELS